MKTKKISQLENSTPNSSAKKKKNRVGERKHRSVNDIRKLWEKVDENSVKIKDSSRKKIIEESNLISTLKVKQIVTEINTNIDSVNLKKNPENPNRKPSSKLSQSKLDAWVKKDF